MAQFTVTLKVDVNLDDWAEEYGVSVAEALTQVLGDLREPGWYLQGVKWSEPGALGKLAQKPRVELDVLDLPAARLVGGPLGRLVDRARAAVRPTD